MTFIQTGPVSLAARDAQSGAAWRSRTAVFIGLFVLAWLVLFIAYVALPNVQTGSTVIYLAKFDQLATHRMFAPEDRTRILMFGNSRVITGFYPSEFDPVFGQGVRSFNLGLPADERFLPVLEATLAAGNIPTHVILTLPWDANTEPASPFTLLRDDNRIVNWLLPFRSFPRDFVLFAYSNRLRFGQGMGHASGQVDLMIENRGWYFINSQSHFPNDQLPDDFSIPTDRPSQSNVRQLPERSLVRDRLMRLASQHGFQILLVPSSYRVGAFAPTPAAEQDRDTVISTSPLIRVIGPDYWTYPARYFADPVHLNPSGRSVYTADLARLLKKHQAF